MYIQCPVCNQISEVDCEIAEGQSLRCPYCNGKFTYRPGGSTIVLPPVGGERSGRGGERKGSLGRKKLGFIAGGVTVACVLVVVFLTGHFGETPLERNKREWKEAAAKVHHYKAEERIDLDLNGKIDMQRVFGLRWGEKPRRKFYKRPCNVIYDLEDDLFSEVKLCYGEKDGLDMVVLGRKVREKTREDCSKAFEKMIALAERAAGGGYRKIPAKIGWLGFPEVGNLVSVILFENTLSGDNPGRTFMVIRPSEKDLKEKAKQAEKLKAEVEKRRRWYNQQLGRHNLNEHSFQVSDTGDGDGYVYCLCLFNYDVTITITEGRGMLICDGPIDRGYAAELLAVRKEMYQVDGK